MNKTISFFDNKVETKIIGTTGSIAIYEKIKELKNIKESNASQHLEETLEDLKKAKKKLK